MQHAVLQPLVGAAQRSASRRVAGSVPASNVSRFTDDAGIVSAAGQYEADVGIGLVVHLVDGAPGGYAVRIRTQRKHWRSDIAKRNDAAAGLIAARREFVVQE
ncbi:hypothetical protein D3C72_2224650 [compost metagenome]